jgi:hypothetical protein
VAMACIPERSNFINSAGGYLRDLTKRAELGEFSLGPMLMALSKANGEGTRNAGVTEAETISTTRGHFNGRSVLLVKIQGSRASLVLHSR